MNEGIPAAFEKGFWYGEDALLHQVTGDEIPVSQMVMLVRAAVASGMSGRHVWTGQFLGRLVFAEFGYFRYKRRYSALQFGLAIFRLLQKSFELGGCATNS